MPSRESIDHTPLPRSLLFELLPASFAPWGASSWYPSRPPTAESIRRIEEILKIPIPQLFIDIAVACPLYGGWFGSIGDDFESDNHLLSINAAFREEGLPTRYVLFNHGHDYDCDAWDTQLPGANGELQIVYFDYSDSSNAPPEPQITAQSFEQYLSDFVRFRSVRCPEEPLRSRAQRLLKAYEESPRN